MGEITIERATRDDGLAVAGMVLAMDREDGAAVRPGFLGEYADAWLADFAARPTWLAKQPDGNPVGLLQAALVRKLPSLRRETTSWVHVSLVYVRPAHRRLGLGESLIGAMIDWGDRTGVERYQLNSTPIGRSLYARMGFDAPDSRLMERRERP